MIRNELNTSLDDLTVAAAQIQRQHRGNLVLVRSIDLALFDLTTSTIRSWTYRGGQLIIPVAAAEDRLGTLTLQQDDPAENIGVNNLIGCEDCDSFDCAHYGLYRILVALEASEMHCDIYAIRDGLVEQRKAA